jgi:flagellin-like hook-associated protein FlgL
VTISDRTDSLGNASISVGFRATDYAKVAFGADERGYGAGNKNDHIEMRKTKVNIPPKELPIQTTSTNQDHIDIKWQGLNNAIIGIQGTNTKTIQDARYAIDEIGGAIKMVSDTRSVFGAQQNRLEHAVRQNDNTAENTQAAESLIRDTDMAREMVKFSITSILMQAGEAMMGQANQSNQGVLSLIA